MSDREKRLERALEKIATGRITGEPEHSGDASVVKSQIAREALADDGTGGDDYGICLKCEDPLIEYMTVGCPECDHPPKSSPTPPGNDARGEALEALEEVKSLVNSPRCQITQKEWAGYRSLLDDIGRALTAPPTVPEAAVTAWSRIKNELRCGDPPYQADIDELDRALAQHSEPGRGECGWSLDDEDCYQTDCGTEFVSPDYLTLDEMPSMKYCSNCGRRIRDDGRMGDA